MSANKNPVTPVGRRDARKLGPRAAPPVVPAAEPVGTPVFVQEHVLADIRHELGNFFHKLYYWAECLRDRPTGEPGDSTATDMLERTLKNLEGFLKVSLEYFHPTQLSFTRMAVPDLVEGLLFQARSHANGTPVEVQAAGVWGDTTVLVDPGHLSKVLGIAVGHLGKGAGAGTRIHIGVERCTRRDGMGLEVRFTLAGPSEGTAPVRTSDAGIEWAVAQKVIALHGGELAERADEGGAKALTLFLPLSPSSPVEV